VLFAVGNLIDLAVQGRDHTSAVAAAILVFVTGVVYVTAQFPRVVAGPDDVLIRNPLRDHVIGWGSVVKIDTLDLLRVHCEWEADGVTKAKTFHAWAVQHSRRREAMSKVRQDRRMRRGLAPTRPDSLRGGGFGSGTTAQENPLGSPQHAVDSLKAREAAARERELPATAPVSTWRWRPIVALLAPAILLAIVAAL
jgi:Bacterial PH domain